jgi:hypothetical protein
MATIAVPATITDTGASEFILIPCLLFSMYDMSMFRNKTPPIPVIFQVAALLPALAVTRKL